MPTSPSRRLVLAALTASAATGLAGCSTPWGTLRVQPLGGDPPPTTPPPGPDELATRSAVDAAGRVLAALDALGTGLGPAADAVRALVLEQLSALGEPAPSATPSTTASATATASASSTNAPAGTSALVQALRDAAASARADLAEVAGGTARLLACLAAGDDVAADAVEGLALRIATSSTSGASSAAAPTAAASASSAAASSGSPSPSASSSPTPAAGSGEQLALTAALGVEEAAAYGYGVLAVRLQDDQRDQAVADLAAHSAAVELLRDRLLALGASPPPASPAWALPSPVADAAGAVPLAVQLEGASAAAAADLVAESPREQRAVPAVALLDAARRWQRWRAAGGAQDLLALPGLSGR